ncbi:flagellar biosynthetic protein FliR [Pisciglobus halotolerans]|uniref:Flagellar biosynthetic protein FliR n=1 Tax=Pisciglobus halotolerans TaxID=745365 RepID=A0A1I3ANE4_9LACT|nr:flagellar biosynthetic protein FliR [Pisciglobus halotolerans]SFH51336.1 flagellar biosynthetic protein FliR [Pisciglobus halotolerans]
MADLQQMLLIVLRVATFIVVCPGFSFTGLPNLIKVTLSFGISLVLFPLIPEMGSELSTLALILIAVKECLVGFALGYICRLFFTAVEIAGKLVDFQVGFSMGETFNPSLGISVSNYGQVYYWLSMAVFFLTDLHHVVLQSLVQSFTYFPLTSQHLGNFGVEGILKLFVQMFETSLTLAAPLMIVAMISEIVLGLISRSVPQINVLILGMPLKVLMSLFFTLIFLPPLLNGIKETLPKMVYYMNEFMQSLP